MIDGILLFAQVQLEEALNPTCNHEWSAYEIIVEDLDGVESMTRVCLECKQNEVDQESF